MTRKELEAILKEASEFVRSLPPYLRSADVAAEKARIRSERIAEARVKLRAKLDATKSSKSVTILPRYDEVFFDGVLWLDSLS